MRKREKMKKGVYNEVRSTKQLFQHLGGFGLTTVSAHQSSGKGAGPVFVLTNTCLITEREKL